MILSVLEIDNKIKLQLLCFTLFEKKYYSVNLDESHLEIKLLSHHAIF